VKRTLVVGVLALVGLVLAPASPASAHPLGNFTVNTYSGIVVGPDLLEVHYVLDLAEIPTFQEMAYIDTEVDGVVTTEEATAYAAKKARELLRNLSLSVDGRPVELTVRDSVMELLPGQAGNDVLRLEVTYVAPVAQTGRVSYEDRNFLELKGWREITAIGVDGRAVSGSTVPAESVSDELRSYPEDILKNPVEVTEATFSFAPGAGAVRPDGDGSVDARPGTADDAFTALIGGPLSVWVVLGSLLLAMGFGAVHALAPGHGKSLMAAYLVGSGGRIRQAAAVGLAVATMHTASVIGLFLVVLWIRQTVPGYEVYAWLAVAAGLMAVILGTGLLISRLHGWQAARAHDHDHEHGVEHEHAHLPPGTSLLSRRGLAALAVAGGLIPSPSALLVLTGSVSLDRVGFGLALVVAFSVGLAVALTLLGMAAIGARDWTAKRMSGGFARAVPIAGAMVVIVFGAFVALRGVTQL
jgi:ABC-type nickel/cobalt efflux system permease component RcnA